MSDQGRITLIFSAKNPAEGIKITIADPMRTFIAAEDMQNEMPSLAMGIIKVLQLSYKYNIYTIRVIAPETHEKYIVSRIQEAINKDYPHMQQEVEVLTFNQQSKYQRMY